MVDITTKPQIQRESKAKGQLKLRKETIALIKQGKIEKGDPFQVAKVAGILAAKKTSSLIPLCHQIPLTSVKINLKIVNYDTVEIESTIKTKAQTGVEMEALTATAVALLTVWDMTKQYEKDAEGQYPFTAIRDICVTSKLKEQPH